MMGGWLYGLHGGLMALLVGGMEKHSIRTIHQGSEVYIHACNLVITILILWKTDRQTMQGVVLWDAFMDG